MPLLKIAGMVGLCCLCALSQTTTGRVGNGSTADVQTAFLAAYNRNGFSSLVGAPNGDVTAFLSTGLIQTFPGAADKTQTYALIKPDATATMNVVQVYPEHVRVITAIWDMRTLVFLRSIPRRAQRLISAAAAGNSCQYQTFSGDYALFLYNAPLPNGAAQLYIADPFDALWNSLGGISTMGPATGVLSQIASQYRSSSALTQSFDQGTMDNLNGGPLYRASSACGRRSIRFTRPTGPRRDRWDFPSARRFFCRTECGSRPLSAAPFRITPSTLVATSTAACGFTDHLRGRLAANVSRRTSPVQVSLAVAGGVAVAGTAGGVEFIEHQGRADSGQRHVSGLVCCGFRQRDGYGHGGRARAAH